jgi:hypothetical protein
MRSIIIVAILIMSVGGVIAVPAQRAAGQTAHFYNVDTERKVDGTIREILFEPRYEDRARFLILILEEKQNRDVYRAEISPVWFFNHDLHVGESVEIVGSLYTKEGTQYIIARELKSAGETFQLRDSRGFPTWRGGKMKRAGQRKGRGF